MPHLLKNRKFFFYTERRKTDVNLLDQGTARFDENFPKQNIKH